MHILQPAGNIPANVLGQAQQYGDAIDAYADDGTYNKSYIDGIAVYIIQATKFDGVTKTKVLRLTDLKLVTSTRTDSAQNVFSMDSAVSPVYTSELGTVGIDSVDLQYGNYLKIVSDTSDVVSTYSITAPAHDLADDFSGVAVPGWNRVSRASGVTGVDVYTCFSDQVYNPVENLVGTAFPPEGSFSAGVILGVGIDANGDINLAQNVKILKGSGYYGLNKPNVDSQGLYYKVVLGTAAQAQAEAVKEGCGVPIVIFENVDSATEYFVEFLRGEGGTGVKSFTNSSGWSIIDRKPSTRIPKQWFYTAGVWVQYTKNVVSKLKFGGLKLAERGAETEYTLEPSGMWNGKALSLSHIAHSISGSSGDRQVVPYNVYRENTADALNIGTAGTGPYGSYNVGDSVGVSGGAPPYTYSISGGTIDVNTGRVLILPSCPTATATITVRDSCGTTKTRDIKFNIPGAAWFTAYQEFPPEYFGPTTSDIYEYSDTTRIKISVRANAAPVIGGSYAGYYVWNNGPVGCGGAPVGGDSPTLKYPEWSLNVSYYVSNDRNMSPTICQNTLCIGCPPGSLGDYNAWFNGPRKMFPRADAITNKLYQEWRCP